MRRIGVFICHCGSNIAGTVDAASVADTLEGSPGVAHAVTHSYLCSELGQSLIREAILERRLEGIVVAACSPAMHEMTFRNAAASAGLNPYLVEIANIREQCSWVHQGEPDGATGKAVDTIHTLLEKVRGDESLVPLAVPVTRRALVIGGGIAGMQAALDIADGGYDVALVERQDKLGGHLKEIYGLYPNLESTRVALEDRIRRVVSHPRIHVMLGAEVVSVGGFVGSFQADVAAADNEGEPREIDAGAIIVATGYDTFPLKKLGDYGVGTCPDVIDGLALERMLAPDGLTEGRVLRPSDGRVPREVVFVQCVGSRDPERGVPYCSEVCCMSTAKQATLYKRQVPDGQAYVFYTDIRSGGKGYDEFVQLAMEAYGVLYLRGEVSRVFSRAGRVVVWGGDTLSGYDIEIEADLVVLATAMIPSPGAAVLGRILRAPTDETGFFAEAHPKLRPVESLTAGIYLAGAAQGPKGIPQTLAQASGAAAKVLSLFSRTELPHEPIVALVEPDLCAGCGVCIALCPYEARSMDERVRVAVVREALCQGCGVCVVACPNKACSVLNWSPTQLMGMLEAAL